MSFPMATLASFTLQFKPYFEPILLDLLQTCSPNVMIPWQEDIYLFII